MIIFEDGIRDIISQIPAKDGFKPNFHWGDQEELTRYIALQDQPYPLIWLVSGSEEHDERGTGYVIRSCKFILATRNLEEDELNDVRLRSSFDNVLVPLAERLIEGMTKSIKTKINDQKYTFTKFPNYAEYNRNGSKERNKTIDYWDAATIECSIRMNNNSQNIIIWQNV